MSTDPAEQMSVESAPDISVVLITCNRATQMQAALRSLMAQEHAGWSYEIVVVNDASTDSTQAVAEALAAQSTVPFTIISGRGEGVPAARNIGFNAACGQWIASFDDDQIASTQWLQEFRKAAAASGALCLGGALSLSLPAQHIPVGPRARRLLGEHLLPGELQRYPPGMTPATNNALVSRVLFLAVGGFDDSFRQGGSDADFFGRVCATGAPTWFAPRATAEHIIPALRMNADYMKWCGKKVGATRALILLKQDRFLGGIKLLAIRFIALAVRDLPTLLWATLTRNSAQSLDSRCSIWFDEGLVRGLLAYRFPGLFGGIKFLASLNFRRHHGERSDQI